jgi:hypothetical protein
VQLVREVSLEEYARQFWDRQRGKNDRRDDAAFSAIAKGENPVNWLANSYPYKLPQPINTRIDLMRFEISEELDGLLIHEYMVQDAWMVERCLVPCQKTRRLGDMAAIALDRGYFEANQSDTQAKLFQEWRQKASLKGFVDVGSYPLAEVTWANVLEIVDGWGRLHAMAALVRRGIPFEAFDCFIARRP